jgi:diguanylate cyclase (GGDEF)-like protein
MFPESSTVHRFRLPPDSALDAATWQARHRIMLGVFGVQAVVLFAWMLLKGLPAYHLAVDLAPLAATGAVAAWARAPRVRAVAMALALFTQSALVVHLGDGVVPMHFHYFVMLCLLAQYEEPRPFIAGIAYVVLQHGIIGSLMPEEVNGSSGEGLRPWSWAAIHGAFVVAASVVLVGGWRTNALNRVADRRSQQDLTGLRRLAQDVASHDDARPAVLERVLEIAQANVAFLIEPTEDGTALALETSTTPHLKGYRIPLDGRRASGARAAYLSGEPGFHADLPAARPVNPDISSATGARSFAFEPVMVDGRAVAVLTVGWREHAPRLGSRERQMVAIAAHEAAVALQRLAAIRRLETAALTDALTGVANRRAFDQCLPQEIERARRSGQPLALATMDLNQFKVVNDREGHEAGDHLLRASADAWSEVLRGTDMLARLGGDEFAMLLPGCDSAGVAAVADRLREVLPHASGCGVGTAVWDGEESASSLMARADGSLYEDKARTAPAGRPAPLVIVAPPR